MGGGGGRGVGGGGGVRGGEGGGGGGVRSGGGGGGWGRGSRRKRDGRGPGSKGSGQTLFPLPPPWLWDNDPEALLERCRRVRGRLWELYAVPHSFKGLLTNVHFFPSRFIQIPRKKLEKVEPIFKIVRVHKNTPTSGFGRWVSGSGGLSRPLWDRMSLSALAQLALHLLPSWALGQNLWNPHCQELHRTGGGSGYKMTC